MHSLAEQILDCRRAVERGQQQQLLQTNQQEQKNSTAQSSGRNGEGRDEQTRHGSGNSTVAKSETLNVSSSSSSNLMLAETETIQVETANNDDDEPREVDEEFLAKVNMKRAAREGTVSISGEVMRASGDGSGRSSSNNHNDEISPSPPAAAAAPPQPQPIRPSQNITQPRLLSTCLGTASPLAWTCRYSAPSRTVQLVLDLDPKAVRTCLPQLGTPLHECVGRPRPLRKLPYRSKDNVGVGGGDNVISSVAAAVPKSRKKRYAKMSSKKRREYRRNTAPRILTGLREWRRTVRALISADALLVARELEETNGAPTNGGTENGSTATHSSRSVAFEVDSISNNTNLVQQLREQRRQQQLSTRALLAQDADGNTPLHFMVRKAASPTFGGGRWQTTARDFDDDENSSSEDDEEEEDRDEPDGGGELGEDGVAMDVDNEIGEGSSDDNEATNPLLNISHRDPRQIHGTGGSSWDGVRWCMEAHLRRVERRMARKNKQLKREISVECGGIVDSVASRRRKRIEDSGVSSVQICGSSGDEDMPDIEGESLQKQYKRVEAATAAASLDQKLPAKRKSDETDLQRLTAKKNATTIKARERRHKSSSRRKYIDADERQDCCYDPLLGAVKDLVHSCPESVGVPDNREYEETPLIVALKANIYIAMEPENDFQLLRNLQGMPGAEGVMEGGAIINEGLNAGGGGLFPFPDFAALIAQRDRPIGFFAADEDAVMAVFRGHGNGRRAEYPSARRSPIPREERSENATSQKSTPSPEGEAKATDTTSGTTEEEAVVNDDSSACSSVSDDESFDGEDDPRFDAFVPSHNEHRIISVGGDVADGQFGVLHRRPRYDYQTALEYRIFSLVKIMLHAYPRAACLMVSDYTPLHSAVFHGRCPDTIRLLLDAEARYWTSVRFGQGDLSSSRLSNFEPCPTLVGPAMLCTNTRGEVCRLQLLYHSLYYTFY